MELSIQVLSTTVVQHKQSVYITAADVGSGKSTVREMLKQHKVHTFQIYSVQEPKNMTHMEDISDMSDMYGSVNTHNCQYWSDNNPRWNEESRTQNPEKLNVEAGNNHNTVICFRKS